MPNLLADVHDFTPTGIAVRLVIACLAGALVGLEREFKNKRAGLKTHALVCLGAALCMVVSEYVSLGRVLSTDATRLGANVITGVGFLGAATIMMSHNSEVRGLTTAAGLWACACVGLAVGSGNVEVAAVAVGLVMFVQLVLSRLDVRIERVSRAFEAYVELAHAADVRRFLGELRSRDTSFSNLRVRPGELGGDAVSLTFEATCLRMGQKQGVVEALCALDYVTYLETY